MSGLLFVCIWLGVVTAAYLMGVTWGLTCNWLTVRIKWLERLSEPRILREIRADAWDEGYARADDDYELAANDYPVSDDPLAANPYRKASA